MEDPKKKPAVKKKAFNKKSSAGSHAREFHASLDSAYIFPLLFGVR